MEMSENPIPMIGCLFLVLSHGKSKSKMAYALLLENRFCKKMHGSWLLKFSKIAPWHSLLLLFSTGINFTEQLTKSLIRCGDRCKTQVQQILISTISACSKSCGELLAHRFNIQRGKQFQLVSKIIIQARLFSIFFCLIFQRDFLHTSN